MFITAWEVIKNAPLSKEFPVDKISGNIDSEEEGLRLLFGEDFYDTLIADLKDDVGVYSEWKATASYLAGANVVFYGKRYKANDAATGGDVPGISPKWDAFQIFETDAYNDLYEKYLKRYLALAICLPSVTFGTFQAGGAGLMAHNDAGTGTATVNREQFGIWKGQIIDQRDKTRANMINWIKKQHAEYTDPTESPFNLVEGIGSGTNCSTGNNTLPKGGRQFFFDT